jgi:hypothetical protein
VYPVIFDILKLSLNHWNCLKSLPETESSNKPICGNWSNWRAPSTSKYARVDIKNIICNASSNKWDEKGDYPTEKIISHFKTTYDKSIPS